MFQQPLSSRDSFADTFHRSRRSPPSLLLPRPIFLDRAPHLRIGLRGIRSDRQRQQQSTSHSSN
jgi:hypothetical protein